MDVTRGFKEPVPGTAAVEAGWSSRRYLPWAVQGLEEEARLEQAYYVCPRCDRETLFLSGPETAIAGRSLE